MNIGSMLNSFASRLLSFVIAGSIEHWIGVESSLSLRGQDI